MRLFDLFPGHLLHHLFEGDGRVRIAADGGERVPHVGAHEIRRRHAPADLVVPADTGLGAGMPFHGTAQIPLERPLVVPLHAEAHGIHDTDQFLRIRVSGAGRRPERLVGGFILAGLHHVARRLDLGARRHRGQKNGKQNGCGKFLHRLRLSLSGLFLFAGLSAPALAVDLPTPLTDEDFLRFDPGQAKVGQLLFYDKILSGNRNISCGTCHHPDFGTSDGLSLGIGEGGTGLGPNRSAGKGADRIRKRIPRNAPALWNLGAKEIHTMFHDGRLSISDVYENGFNSPAEEWLPDGLNSLLAAQALFPLVAQFEMAGNPRENEIAGAVHDRIDAAWPILAKRVRVIPEYGDLFVTAFDHIDKPEDVTVVEVVNALAAFMALEWRSTGSPFDMYLAGERSALDADQKRGLELFYGKAGCAVCHSGSLLSDQEFHALGLPPFGPGRTRLFDPIVRDVGRMGESNRLEDAYRFRTPMLRNVALTAPYGHNGAYPTLEGMVRHHLDSDRALKTWRPEDAALPEAPWLQAIDFVVFDDSREMERQARARDITPVQLTDREVADVVAFLEALTDKTIEDPPFGIPERVPSGLAID
jgi:cytochrome c peroxidase